MSMYGQQVIMKLLISSGARNTRHIFFSGLRVWLMRIVLCRKEGVHLTTRFLRLKLITKLVSAWKKPMCCFWYLGACCFIQIMT